MKVLRNLLWTNVRGGKKLYLWRKYCEKQRESLIQAILNNPKKDNTLL